MTNTLVVLSGWGLGVETIQGLADELKAALPDFIVQLQPLPNMIGKDPVVVIQQLNDELPKNCWLAGWSLGGMLVTALAAQRQSTCAGLITFASNACFVSNETWSKAMPKNTFAEFYKLCQSNLATGLKRFTILCSQGADRPRQLSRELLEKALINDTASTLAGLDFLAKLDNRAAITSFSGQQLCLLAETDALVPAEAAIDLQALNPKAVIEILGKSHASVLAEPQLLAQRMAAFILSKQNA